MKGSAAAGSALSKPLANIAAGSNWVHRVGILVCMAILLARRAVMIAR
jgi:hypothetical protein